MLRHDDMISAIFFSSKASTVSLMLSVKAFKKTSFLVNFAQTLAIIKSASIEICKPLTE
jgi:hypothetical protein